MVGEWPFARLGELSTVQGGYAFKSCDFTNVGVPVLKIKNVREREIDVTDVEHVSEEVARSTSRYFCKNGDILISMTGSGPQAPNSVVGRVARFIGQDNRYLINQRVGRFIIKDRAKLDGRFLFYVLIQNEIQNSLVATATGSANQANISANQIESVEIPLPSLDEQRAIAHILGTLDDKIELNRRMNEMLEAMARALFKSWFVDFDPVRAKAERRAGQDVPMSDERHGGRASRPTDPGLPKPLTDLFPDSFEDSESGEIPKGWEVKSLDEIAEFLNGLALQKYPPGDGTTLPVIKIAQLRKGDTEGADRCNTDLPPDYVISDGDVLFSWSGSLECVLWSGGKGALNQHLFKVTSARFPKWFCYLCVHQHLPDFRHIAAGKATTMGHIQRHHLTDAKVVVPEPSVFSVADKAMAPLIEQVMKRRVESRTLATLRDTLLPMLLSGEMRCAVGECLQRETGS